MTCVLGAFVVGCASSGSSVSPEEEKDMRETLSRGMTDEEKAKFGAPTTLEKLQSN